eukprot:CAMPEP_0116994620 /NCGR_PEP_ID=MMETSP0467-20121206/68248_1 /TAXON_ID=283647 /ORGANISM="Mesodinium pulex, Strain SPMC105" /LENGTH=161 /DNA_ID=CAMNT_0004692741 /DNA_START=176 /DNA_END=661 /DNA_ORIENTATION=-
MTDHQKKDIIKRTRKVLDLDHWKRQCSQGVCDEKDHISNALSIVAHFIRDAELLKSWSVTQIHPTYGANYAKATVHMEMVNHCDDSPSDRFIGNADISFYCLGEPGMVTEQHFLRDESTFHIFNQSTYECIQRKLLPHGWKPTTPKNLVALGADLFADLFK